MNRYVYVKGNPHYYNLKIILIVTVMFNKKMAPPGKSMDNSGG